MADTPTRRPLKGSCHCGAVQFILFLTLPHPHPGGSRAPEGSQRFFRCNCTNCQKGGSFHIRPASMHDDVLLLSPLDPHSQMGDYLHGDKEIHMFFCQHCGVRCFTLNVEGTYEVDDVDLHKLGVSDAEPGKITKVWRVTKTGGHPKYGHHLLINGHLVNARQGFDMRELVEKKIVQYGDMLDDHDPKPISFDRPQEGGCY